MREVLFGRHRDTIELKHGDRQQNTSEPGSFLPKSSNNRSQQTSIFENE